ncbi:MAG: autotransporter domain-containing protein [Methyloceanibacter sp.]
MSPPRARRQIALPRLGCADRKSLLLGTALVSTLLIGTIVAPSTVHAVDCLATAPLPPGAITVNVADEITCFNTNDRAGAIAINLTTGGGANNPYSIYLNNSGALTATANVALAILTRTNNDYSSISIINSNTLVATSLQFGAYGIYSDTNGDQSLTSIVNSGDIIVTGMGDIRGIDANSAGLFSPIGIVNGGKIEVTSTDGVRGIFADARLSLISIVNSGDVEASTAGAAFGIDARTLYNDSRIIIDNGGDFTITAGQTAAGIRASTGDGVFLGISSPISIVNSGTLNVRSSLAQAFGIDAQTDDASSPIAIVNSGDMVATGANNAYGIRAVTQSIDGGSFIRVENIARIQAAAYGQNAMGITARSYGANGGIEIFNQGTVVATNPTSYAHGIHALTNATGSSINIVNGGDVFASGSISFGIYAVTSGPSSPISITNSGAIDPAIGMVAATSGANSGIFLGNAGSVEGAYLGMGAQSTGANSAIEIVNSGAVTSTGGPNFFPILVAPFDVFSIAIGAATTGQGSNIVVTNNGTARGLGPAGIGIGVNTIGAGSSNLIRNSGSVFGGYAGIGAISATDTKIFNSGDVSAGSDLAIVAFGASTEIYNTGRITGFVRLTDEGDTFLNQAGGVFATKGVSDFGGGTDLFQNQSGGTVLAATNPNVAETSSFINLNRFENQGLISLQDGREGDVFEISNTSPEARDLAFVASGNSTLAIDAFLGGSSSLADEFIVNGDISGRTRLLVNNTNFGPGVFNSTGIPVVFANGNVSPDAFFLSQPIDTGFFNYDLFFRPTGSGVFELRSFPGGGALLLPQLVTATHDIWHQTSSTWFDRSADLRVLLHGGAAPAAYDPTLNHAPGTVQGAAMTPAVWVRGGGAWLDRDKSDSVTAYGNTYRFNLDRDLEIIDFQMGLDLGHRGLFASDDILVFGLLGGFVGADLDYNRLVRNFDFSGGQVGGYATYLRGGLFVDTLLNAHLLEMETAALGFPSSLDATTLGLRTDTGYRFGSFSGGAFIEPLATLSVTWADIDGFSLGGNRVSFDDEANVRGRLGLRVGTSYGIWGTTTVEPFVIGSVWGHLSGDNQATLTSSGTTFRFEDSPEDVWGEVSLGVNFFNPSASTAVFAKLDVTFGDDVDGIGGKAGMRVSW